MGEAKRRSALPSLEQYLKTAVASQDAAARDEFAALVDLTERILKDRPAAADADPAIDSYWRCVKLALLATVEGCNAELYQHGRTADQAVAAMTRSMGLAAGYALMSLDWKENTPHRMFARVFAELFATGMKFAIDECLAREAAPNDARSDG